jgi:transcriptional regulator with XRE-family HTH domain
MSTDLNNVATWEPRPLPESMRAARTAAGITTMEVEARTGVSASSITRVETGHRSLKWPTVVKVMSRCGFGLEHFFPDATILAAADRIRSRLAKERRAERRAAHRIERDASIA